MGRVRQHKNPLSFRERVATPDWGRLLRDPTLPFEVDLGTGHGDFLLERARSRPDLDLIGLELRLPMVERVNARIAREGLANATVVRCNANLSLRDLFPASSLRAVYVHFPDPWFKARHKKRRVMTPDLVDAAAERLAPGGLLRFMTDHLAYAAEVLPWVEAHPAFVNAHGPGQPAPEGAELPPTHRETWHRGRGDPIARYEWRRRG